jgi:hypothetical protein
MLITKKAATDTTDRNADSGKLTRRNDIKPNVVISGTIRRSFMA